MKKLLSSILIVLLIVLAYFVMFKGLTLGKIEILSVEQIINANDKLTSDIEATNALLKKEYPSKKTDLSVSVDELLNKKEEYFTLARVSTDSEITKANTEETYLVEYLWVRVGNHAKSRGVNIRMDVNSGDAGEPNMKNIAFTVTGQYGGIIQFVSALEDDTKLNFKIENFKMSGSSSELTATFNVRGVRIKTEAASSPTTQSDSTNDNISDNTVDNDRQS